MLPLVALYLATLIAQEPAWATGQPTSPEPPTPPATRSPEPSQAKGSKLPPLAGTVVRSRTYLLHRKPQEVEEFIGDVRYRQADREVRADWAEFDRGRRTWRARGHISGSLRLKNGNLLQLWGDRADHDLQTRRGLLTGEERSPVSFEHVSSASLEHLGSASLEHTRSQEDRGTLQGPAKISHRGSSDRISWDEGTSSLELAGNVHLWGTDGEVWCERAVYRDPERTLTLTGRRPVLYHEHLQWTGVVQSDRILLSRNEQQADADGDVRGWVHLKERIPHPKR